MAKRVTARKVKTHNQYTYEQAADALGVSVQTVRLWRRSGLPVLDSQKPHLILGFALKDFVRKRSHRPERRLARDQFLCMTCNGTPAGLLAAWLITCLTPPRGAVWRHCARTAKAFAASSRDLSFALSWPQT